MQGVPEEYKIVIRPKCLITYETAFEIAQVYLKQHKSHFSGLLIAIAINKRRVVENGALNPE